MESKFPQRVALERRVLDLVNSSSIAEPPLVGLANVTVSRWLSGLSRRLASHEIAELEVAIRLSAEAVRSEADISDEVFVDIDEVQANSAIRRLAAALDNLA